MRWAFRHLAIALVSLAVFTAVLLLGFKIAEGAGHPPGARKVILIRHGEKEGHKGHWKNGLSHAGKARAQCLAARYGGLGVTNLFAFDNKPTTRPVDTLVPLARELGIEINTQFKRGQIAQMANFIFALPLSSLSIICWQHDVMGQIAQRLGVADADIPADLMHVPKDSWDKQWSIYYNDTAGAASNQVVGILEEQQHCTLGDPYFARIHLYWAVGLGVPLVLLLGYTVITCLAAYCSGRKERDGAGGLLQEDPDDEPLLDEASRSGL